MKSLTFCRVGGLSPVKQKKNKSVPTRYGLYAFVYPYIELFFLSATNDNGIATEKERQRKNTRYYQFLREGYRKFEHVGYLWTRIYIPGAKIKNGWCYTDTETLKSMMPKLKVDQAIHKYSKDHFEVFIEEIVSPKGKSYGCAKSYLGQ